MRMIVIPFVFLKLGMAVAVAAPLVKTDPVAEGYPAWEGLTDKNRVVGRELCASDLRHKVTIVIDFEPNPALQSQFVLAGGLVRRAGVYTGDWNWDSDPALPRNVVTVLSNRGGGMTKDHEAIQAAISYNGNDMSIRAGLADFCGKMCSIYDDVTFAGAPDTAGKRPYVYVMGPTGTAPVFQGALDAKSIKDVHAAVNAELAKMEKAEFRWVPFYGSVSEPKFYPQISKALKKGKPLKPIEMAILKDVRSKDAERANEAQTLFDALEQTRSDILFRIQLEASPAPHRAYYDLQQLLKYWPGEKKKIAEHEARIKAVPGALKLAQVVCKVTTWECPDFMCKNGSEAKKIVQELTKMKIDIAKLKESQSIPIQNGALMLETHIDTLIEAIPSRVVPNK